MTAKKPFSIATILLSIILIASLLNVQVAFADGETPTEPPAPTQVETEPPPPTEPPAELVLPTETPIEATLEPVEPTPVDVTLVTEIPDTAPTQETLTDEEIPVTGMLFDVPNDTNVVVLDEQGLPLVLGSQEAVDVAVSSDPVWCPASVIVPTPGANGCSSSYATITALLDAMRTTPLNFDENGTIFLEKPPGQGFTTPLILNDSDTSLAGSFAALSLFDLTIRGGWNNGSSGTVFNGKTNFGASGANEGYILIGSETNPWAGDITLRALQINDTSAANAVTVYTTSGNITLDNVDVDEQAGGYYTGYLQTNSGNISVGASYFNGRNNSANTNQGFYAESNTGSISITGTSGTYTFQDALGTGPANHNGATLSAPTVTLTNVLSQGNDGNGIEILNASVVNLNNVISGPNANNQGNGLSGVLINGTGSTIVNVNGGVFAGNLRYGIEVLNGSLSIQTAPSCPIANGLGCYAVSLTDSTAPEIAPIVTGTAGLNDWYTSDVSVTWDLSDPESNIASSSGCSDTSLTSDTNGTTLTCSATNSTGLSNSNSVTIKIDKGAPTASLSITGGTLGNNGWYVSDLTVHTSGTAPISGVTCTADQTQTADTIGTSFNGSCTSGAGVSANAAPLTVKLDQTPPTIAFHTDLTATASTSAGAVVAYSLPSTADNLSGALPASCAPASGSLFLVGNTTITCNTVDDAGNAAVPTSFVVEVTYNSPSNPTLPAPTGTSPTAPAPSATQSSGSSTFIIPLTSAEKIHLDCDSVFWAFGVKFSFVKLCDYQTIVKNISNNKLPGKLPDGFTFVMGLNLSLFKGNQTIQDWPGGASVQLDFPTAGEAKDQFAVLYWNGSEWIELSQQDEKNENSQMLSIMTDKVGTFVLVKK